MTGRRSFAVPSELPTSRGHSERVLLDGWDAHILRWGEPSPHRVVLLHGFASHAHEWQHLAAGLVPGHEVVALDQRGHGRSGLTDRYGTRVLVEDARLLLDALGWDRASLVGHSTGGQGALMLAARYPERVDRMVIIESGPQICPEDSVRADLRGRPRVFASVKGALSDARLSFPAADEALLRDRVEHDLVPNRDGGLTSRTAAGLREGTVKSDDFSAAECWAAWRSVIAHTLLVHGAESDVLTYPLVARLASVRPDVEVVHIEGAAHAVQLDRPRSLQAVVSAFLSAGPARTSTRPGPTLEEGPEGDLTSAGPTGSRSLPACLLDLTVVGAPSDGFASL
jgi:esterase